VFRVSNTSKRKAVILLRLYCVLPLYGAQWRFLSHYAATAAVVCACTCHRFRCINLMESDDHYCQSVVASSCAHACEHYIKARSSDRGRVGNAASATERSPDRVRGTKKKKKMKKRYHRTIHSLSNY